MGKENFCKSKRAAKRSWRMDENGTKVSRSWERNEENAQATIAEGERLFDQLNATLFTKAHPSIDGMVAMTYALSKTYVALKQLLKEYHIDAEPHFMTMAKWFEELKY